MSETPRDCEHGHHARACQVCELERDLAAARADGEALRRQRDQLVIHLAEIHNLIQPGHVVRQDGVRLEFVPPPHMLMDMWRRLSNAIRDIPAAIDAALAREQETKP